MATENAGDQTEHVESEDKKPPESKSYTQTLMTACNEAAEIGKNVAHKVYTTTKETVSDVIEAVQKYSTHEEEVPLKKTGSTSVDPEIPFPSQFYFIDPFSNDIPLPVPNMCPGHTPYTSALAPSYTYQQPAYNPPPPQPVYWPPPMPQVYPSFPPQLYQDSALFNPYIYDYINSINKQWYVPDSTQKDKKKRKKRKHSKTSKKKKKKRRSRKEEILEDNEPYSWSHPAIRVPYHDTATVYQTTGSYEGLPDNELAKPTVAHMRQLNKRKKSQIEPQLELPPTPRYRYSSFDKKLSTFALEGDQYSEAPDPRRRSADVVYVDDSVGSDVDDGRVRRKSAATSISEETVKLPTPQVTRVPSPEENVTRLSATLFRSLQVNLRSRKGNSLKVKRFNMDTQSAQLLGSFFSCEARSAKKVRPKKDRKGPPCGGFSSQYRQTSTSLCGCSCVDYIDATDPIPTSPGRHLKQIMSHFYSDLMNLPEKQDPAAKKEGCAVNSNKSNTVLSAPISPACTCDFKVQCKLDKKSESNIPKENVETPTEVAQKEKCDELRFSCPDTNTCRMGVLELNTKPHTKHLSSSRQYYFEEHSEISEEASSENDLTASSRSNNQSHDESDNRLRKRLMTRIKSPKSSQHSGKNHCPSAVSFSQTFCVSSTKDCQVKISQNISATRRSPTGRVEHLPLSYNVQSSSERQKCKQLVCTFDDSATDRDSGADEKPYKCLYVRARSRPKKSMEHFRKCSRKYCLCHPQSSLAVCDLRHEDDGRYCKRTCSTPVYLSDSSNENLCFCRKDNLTGFGAASPRRNRRRNDPFYGMDSMGDYHGMTKCSNEIKDCCVPKCSIKTGECYCLPKCSRKSGECCSLPKCSRKTGECCCLPKCYQKTGELCCLPKCSLKPDECCSLPKCSLNTDECCCLPQCSYKNGECCCMPKCSLKMNECCCVPKCSLRTNECCYKTQCSLVNTDCRQAPLFSQLPNDCCQTPICSQLPNDFCQTPLCSQLPNDCCQMPICSQLQNDCRQTPLCSQLPNDCRQTPICSQLPNDCCQTPICSQLPNDCRQTPLFSQQQNDCRHTPLCSQLLNDCCQTPLCSQQQNGCRQTPLCSQQQNDCHQTLQCSQLPNDCRQSPLFSQQQNDCRQTPQCSQLPYDCRQSPLFSQQQNDCRQTPQCSQLPYDCRQSPLFSQQQNDCRQTPLCSQLPNDCRQTPLCHEQPVDGRKGPVCSRPPGYFGQTQPCSPKFNHRPEQTKDCHQILKYPKEDNPRSIGHENTKECTLPPNFCGPKTRTKDDNDCNPLQHKSRQSAECDRFAGYSEDTIDRPSSPDYRKQSEDCTPSRKHYQKARNNPNVCSTFETCKNYSTFDEDRRNGICHDERSSKMREVCNIESNEKPCTGFTQPRSKKVTYADKETTCHLKVKTDKTKKGNKHKKVDSGYLDIEPGDAANICTRNQCDYMKDSSRQHTINDLGPCDVTEEDKERKRSNAEKCPIQNERSDDLENRTPFGSRNSRKNVPCDETKESELKPPSNSNDCICDFDESIRCEQDDGKEIIAEKRKKFRSCLDEIAKSKGISRRRKTEDSKCVEPVESQEKKFKKQAKSEHSKSRRKSSTRRRSIEAEKSFSTENNKTSELPPSTENNKITDPSSSSSNDQPINPSQNSQSNYSVTASSSSSSDKIVDSSPSSSLTDQSTTQSSSDHLNEPGKVVKEKDKTDLDQSKNGASSKDQISSNPEESFSQFSCRTNNSSETTGTKNLVLNPSVSRVETEDTFGRKCGFVKTCSPNRNGGYGGLDNQGNSYKFMFKKSHHGKSKWPDCRNLEFPKDDRLPCITETKNSPLPRDMERTKSMIDFNAPCQERNQARCHKTSRCSVAEVKNIMPCWDHPSSSNSECKKETKKRTNSLGIEGNKNLHSSNVNRRTCAPRTNYDVAKNTEPECTEAFSSTSLVYPSNYKRLLHYWERICQKCKENTLDMKNNSDSNESKVKSLPKFSSCQEKNKFTKTQGKPKSSRKFSTGSPTDDCKRLHEFKKRMSGSDSSYSCSINPQTSESQCITSDESCGPDDGDMGRFTHKSKSTNRRHAHSRDIITQESQEKMRCFKMRSDSDSDQERTICSRTDSTQKHLTISRAYEKLNDPSLGHSGKQKRHTGAKMKEACPDDSHLNSKPLVSSQNLKDKKRRQASHGCADFPHIHHNHHFKDKKQMNRGYLDSESGDEFKKLYSSCSRENEMGRKSSHSLADNKEKQRNQRLKDKKQTDTGYLDSESGKDIQKSHSSSSREDINRRNSSRSFSDNRQIPCNHSKHKRLGNSSTEYKSSHSSESREDVKYGRRHHKQRQSNHDHIETKGAKRNNSRTDSKQIQSNHSGAWSRKTSGHQSLDDSQKSSSNHSREDNKQKHSGHEGADSKKAHRHNIHKDRKYDDSNPSLVDSRKKSPVQSLDGTKRIRTSSSREDRKQKLPINKGSSAGPCLRCTNVKSPKIMSPCKSCATASLGRQTSLNHGKQTRPNPGKHTLSPGQQTTSSGTNLHVENLTPPCFNGSPGKAENGCADVSLEIKVSVGDNRASSPCFDCVEQTSSTGSENRQGFWASPCISCTNAKTTKKESPCFTCVKRKHETLVSPGHNRYQRAKSTNECPHCDCANVKRKEKSSNKHPDQFEHPSHRSGKHKTIISSPNSPTMLNQDRCCTPSCSGHSIRANSKKHASKRKAFHIEREDDLKPGLPCICCVSPPVQGQSSSSDRSSTRSRSKSKTSTSRSSHKISRKPSSKQASQSESAHMGDQASLTIQLSLSASIKDSNMSFGGSINGHIMNQPLFQYPNNGKQTPGIAFNGSVPTTFPVWENVKQNVRDDKLNACPLYCNSKPQVDDSCQVRVPTENRTNTVRENGGVIYRENTVETFISEPSSHPIINEPLDNKFQRGTHIEETLKDNMYSQIWFNILNVQNAVYDFNCPLSSESNATCVTSISSLPLSQAPDGQRMSAFRVNCHDHNRATHPHDTITNVTAFDDGTITGKNEEPSPSRHGTNNVSGTKSLSKNNSDELEIISLEDDWNHYYSVSGKSEECQSQNCSIPPSSPLQETVGRPDKNTVQIDGNKPSRCLPSEQGPSIVTAPQSFGNGRNCTLPRDTEYRRDTWKMSSQCKSSKGRAACLDTDVRKCSNYTTTDVRKCSNYTTNLSKRNTFKCCSQAVTNKHTFSSTLHNSTRQYSQLNNTTFKGCPNRKSMTDSQNKRSMYCPDYGAACRPPRSPTYKRPTTLYEPTAYNSSLINSIFNIPTHDPGASNGRYHCLRSHLHSFDHTSLSSNPRVNVISAEIKAKILSPPGYHQVHWRPNAHWTQPSHISDEAIVKYLESCTAEEFWRYLYKVKHNYSSDNLSKKNCKSSQTYFNTTNMSSQGPENDRETISHDMEQPIIYPQYNKLLSTHTLPHNNTEIDTLENLNNVQPNNCFKQTQKPNNWHSYNLKCEVCDQDKRGGLMKQEKYKEITPVCVCRKHLATREVRCRYDSWCCCRNRSHSPKYPTHISIHINTDSPRRDNSSRPTSTTQTTTKPSKKRKSKRKYVNKVSKSVSETSSFDSSQETTENMILKYALANKMFKNHRIEKFKKHKNKERKNRENNLRKVSEKKYNFSQETDQCSTSSEDRHIASTFVSTSKIDPSVEAGNQIKNKRGLKEKEFSKHVMNEGNKRDISLVGQRKHDLSSTSVWVDSVDSIRDSSAENVQGNVDLQGLNGQGKIKHIDRLLELDLRKLFRDAQELPRQNRPHSTGKPNLTTTSSRYDPEMSEKPSTSQSRTYPQRPMKTNKLLNLSQGLNVKHSQTATTDRYISSSQSSSCEIKCSQTSIRSCSQTSIRSCSLTSINSSINGVRKKDLTFISTMLQDARLNSPMPLTGLNKHRFTSRTRLDISASGNKAKPIVQWKINQDCIVSESHAKKDNQDGVDEDSVPKTSSIATQNTNQRVASSRDNSQRRPKLAFVLTSPPASTPAITPMSPLAETPVSLNRFTSSESSEAPF